MADEGTTVNNKLLNRINDVEENEEKFFASLLSVQNGLHSVEDNVEVCAQNIVDDYTSKLEEESSNRKLSDDNLQSNIDAEISERKLADENEATAREEAIAKEATRAEMAEKELQSNIDDEETARTTADNELKTSIDTEIEDRKAAISNEETARTTAISEETERAQAAEKANADAIALLNSDNTTEGSVAKTVADAIAKVIDDAPEDLDTLKEVADYISSDKTKAAEFESSISSNAKAIETLNADSSTEGSVDYKVNIETERAQKAESDLSDSISELQTSVENKLDSTVSSIKEGQVLMVDSSGQIFPDAVENAVYDRTTLSEKLEEITAAYEEADENLQSQIGTKQNVIKVRLYGSGNVINSIVLDSGSVLNVRMSISVYEKSEVDTMISNLTSQIEALETRIAALENASSSSESES